MGGGVSLYVMKMVGYFVGNHMSIIDEHSESLLTNLYNGKNKLNLLKKNLPRNRNIMQIT